MEAAYELEANLMRDRARNAVSSTASAEVAAAYRAALRMEPTSADGYYSLAQFLRGEHGTRDEEAVPLLEVAASLDPSHVGALSSLAYLLISGSAEAQKRMLLILSNGVASGMWPSSRHLWRHPGEYLPVVPSAVEAPVHARTSFERAGERRRCDGRRQVVVQGGHRPARRV